MDILRMVLYHTTNDMTTITVEVPNIIATDIWSSISLDRLINYIIDEGKYGLFFDEVQKDELPKQTQNMIIESERPTSIFTSVKNR